MTEADTQDTSPSYDAPEQIFIGGYTSDMGGGAAGLSRLSGSDPSAEPATVGLQSPTFVIKHPTEPWLYAVNETTPGTVSAIRSDDSGLHLINTVESGGDGGCHLCFDHTGNFVVVAHYTSGSIASFRIDDNGALSERIGLLQFAGSGPDPDRQDAAHAHEVVSVGASILVPDLGTDSVHIVRIDDEGNLTPATDSIILPPGSGPRHLVLAGQYLVVACELSATLWVGALDATVGSEGISVPASSRQTDQRIYPSAIAQYGDQIVVANRGADSLSLFTLDATGTPHPLVEIDCGGAWPRDLTVDADQIWVANQVGNNVTVIKPAAVTADPADWHTVQQIATPSPAVVVPAR
jgi:6-phosphogluconolactonase